MVYSFHVRGIPVPQGSKSARVTNGRAIMFEANKKHGAWRKTMTTKFMAEFDEEALRIPLAVTLIFYMPRPRTVTREYPTPKPDLSKLVRAVEDSLVDAKVIFDDSYIVQLVAMKRYTKDDTPGVFVLLSEMQ